jgi:hypothetical protein
MTRRIAILLLLAVFSVNVYRAWTQSVTTDEAFAYNLFLKGSWSNLIGPYDASNHVLYSILAKTSITLFGLTEFTLRIPSLLGGLLYLLAVFRLSRRLLGEGWLRLLALALLCLNPHLMDFMSAARGYGLALGLFLWALDQALEYVEAPAGRDGAAPQRALVPMVAFGLGLAVSANLTLLLPAAGLGAVFLLALIFDKELGGADRAARRWWLAMWRFVTPAALTAYAILVLPIGIAGRNSFYVGELTVRDSMVGLAEQSLFHHPLSGFMARVLPGPGLWYPVLMVMAPLVLAATALACVVAASRWGRLRSFRRLEGTDQFLLLGGGSLLVSVALLEVAHSLFGLPYPCRRTGLYLVPLLVLAAIALWASIRKHRLASILVGTPLGALALLALVHFLAYFQMNHYGEWRFDRSNKQMVQSIRDRQRIEPRPKVRVGCSWVFEPSLNFYRERYRLTWMEPATREGPEGSYDYYILLLNDSSLVARRGLRVLYTDPFAGVVLAAAEPGAARP